MPFGAWVMVLSACLLLVQVQAQQQQNGQDTSSVFQLTDVAGGKGRSQGMSKQILVEGQGKEWVNNDMVRIQASIKSDTKDEGNPEKQMEDIHELVQRLLDLGIPKQNITTYGFYNSHSYDYPPSGFGEPRGNTYIGAEMNIFLYTGEDGFGLWPDLLAFVQDPTPVPNSAVHMVISSIEQFVSEDKERNGKQLALTQAVEDAKATAAQLAMAMGVKLGDVLVISDSPIVNEATEKDDSWKAAHGVEQGASGTGTQPNRMQRSSLTEPQVLLPLGGGKFVTRKAYLAYAFTSDL